MSIPEPSLADLGLLSVVPRPPGPDFGAAFDRWLQQLLRGWAGLEQEPMVGEFTYHVHRLESGDYTFAASSSLSIGSGTNAGSIHTYGDVRTTTGGITLSAPGVGLFFPGRPFGGLHTGGVNVLFLDGSVKFIKESISFQAWYAIATAAGGETVSSDAL